MAEKSLLQNINLFFIIVVKAFNMKMHKETTFL